MQEKNGELIGKTSLKQWIVCVVYVAEVMSMMFVNHDKNTSPSCWDLQSVSTQHTMSREKSIMT